MTLNTTIFEQIKANFVLLVIFALNMPDRMENWF